MGVETRKGKLYYYRKRREGDRIVSEYVGGGELVHLVEYEARKQREQQRRERERLAAERMSIAKLDAGLDRLDNAIDTLMAATLGRASYHNHKGQWRKRRDCRKS